MIQKAFFILASAFLCLIFSQAVASDQDVFTPDEYELYTKVKQLAKIIVEIEKSQPKKNKSGASDINEEDSFNVHERCNKSIKLSFRNAHPSNIRTPWGTWHFKGVIYNLNLSFEENVPDARRKAGDLVSTIEKRLADEGVSLVKTSDMFDNNVFFYGPNYRVISIAGATMPCIDVDYSENTQQVAEVMYRKWIAMEKKYNQ